MNAADLPEIHLFEPSGWAGVFQHSCRVAELLAREGLAVTLHTGHEHEKVSLEGIEICACSWWPLDRRAATRSVRIAMRFATRTLPHLRRRVPARAILHLQGIAAAGALNLLALGSARTGGSRVVYSPHDLFSRRGRLDQALLRGALRLPHAVIAYSHADVAQLVAAGVPAHYSPLVQIVPPPAPEARRRWRERWGADAGTQVVLFAGFIRPEKRLDLLIESARTWPASRKLAVVGEDRGAWPACAELLRQTGFDAAASIGFLPLDEFTAALSAADLVVAPHEQASQSGVLSVAAQLGVATVAADVGGLRELATRTFAAGDVRDLTRAIEQQLAAGNSPPAPVDERAAVEAHVRVYQAVNAR